MKYEQILENKIQCLICPRTCILKEGQEGFCHVRKNENKKLTLTTYGYNTGLSLDPIEKKPLYHFYPSSSILSFGTLGCIMGCRFCQNYHISKSRLDPKSLNKTAPEDIVKIAVKNNIKSVAFTYNDPVAFFEYALDTARLCRESGIKTVAVTSGYINKEPAYEFFNLMDACNIDLKGFSEVFYNKNCFAKLEPVLNAIKIAHKETNSFIELTTLLIEGENDSTDEIKREVNWILENLSDDVPLHFSAFTPKYKMLNKKQTRFDSLIKAYNIAQSEGLKYVYTGNISTVQTSSTYCPNCHKPVIKRNGYSTFEIKMNKNKCLYCGETISGIF